jgi:hypothetical protein
MKTDLEPGRIKGPPAKSVQLLQNAMKMEGVLVTKMEMRRYVERSDKQLGDYSLLTVVVETDRGAVEMKYDEGFRGPDALESAARLLLQYVGLAALINRALIELS